MPASYFALFPCNFSRPIISHMSDNAAFKSFRLIPLHCSLKRRVNDSPTKFCVSLGHFQYQFRRSIQQTSNSLYATSRLIANNCTICTYAQSKKNLKITITSSDTWGEIRTTNITNTTNWEGSIVHYIVRASQWRQRPPITQAVKP